MGGRFKLATLRGIPIYVSSSWIWVAVLYTYSFYMQFSHADGGLSGAGALGFAVLAAALFFGSVFVHELAHAVTARLLGMSVAGITLEFWGGKTETRTDKRGPKGEFLVSAVGPGSTLALAGVFWLLSQGVGSGTTLARLFGDLAWINALLGGINAVPGFPLDGGQMFLSIVWGVTGSRERAHRAASVVGMLVGVGFAATGLYMFNTQNGGFAIWFLFLGYVLITSSRALRGRLAVMAALANGRVAEAMGPPPPAVPATMSLSQALDTFLRQHPDGSFPVVQDDRVVGLVSLGSARRAGSRDPLLPVRDGMIPLSEVPVVDPGDRLDQTVDRLGGQLGLVLRDGRLVGSISTADIGRWYERLAGGATTVPSDGAVPRRPDL